MELIIALAWLYVSARLVCYERCGARYRFAMSVAAYFIIVGSFARSVAIFVNQDHPRWPEVLVALALAFLAYRAKGNVSAMLFRT